jgi:hypothetical protein
VLSFPLLLGCQVFGEQFLIPEENAADEAEEGGVEARRGMGGGVAFQVADPAEGWAAMNSA